MLSKVFSKLNDEGFLARENYSCCQNCAGHEITTEAVELIERFDADPEKIKGAVFYTQQDDDNRRRSGKFYLAYGQMNSSEYGFIGLSDTEVGNRITELLDEYGIKYEWDGNPRNRIFVDLRS